MNRSRLELDTTQTQADADAALADVRVALVHQRASRRVRRTIVMVVISLVCVTAAVMTMVVTALLLAQESPTWWRTVDAGDPAVVDLAERVERAVVSSIHKVRPIGEPWTVAISAPQANAWLNAKLPRWVQSRNAHWPEQLSQVQTHFSNGRISVGVRIGRGDNEQIVAATVNPTLGADGSLWLAQPSTNAGRLDLPAGWTISRLASWLPPEIKGRQITDLVLKALRQEGPALDNTSVRLEDGRRIRLLGLSIDHERLLLTCVTEWRDQHRTANASAGDLTDEQDAGVLYDRPRR